MTVALVILIVATPCLATALAYTHRWRSHPRDCETEPLPPIARAWSFARECFTAVAVVLTWPLGLLVSDRAEGVAGREVFVLVPGFLLNGAALWPLRTRLQSLGWPVVTATRLSWPFDITARARRLEDRLAPLGASGARVTLIAFGSGGWVARHALRERVLPGIERLFTIGTLQQAPPEDAPAPRWNAGSPHLAALMAGDRLPYELEVVAVYSDFDALVPPAQAYYPGAFNIEIAGIGHLSLLTSRKVFDLVVENLLGSIEATGAHE